MECACVLLLDVKTDRKDTCAANVGDSQLACYL